MKKIIMIFAIILCGCTTEVSLDNCNVTVKGTFKSGNFTNVDIRIVKDTITGGYYFKVYEKNGEDKVFYSWWNPQEITIRKDR